MRVLLIPRVGYVKGRGDAIALFVENGLSYCVEWRAGAFAIENERERGLVYLAQGTGRKKKLNIQLEAGDV